MSEENKDSKEKKNRIKKINIIDLFFCVLITMIILGTVYKFGSKIINISANSEIINYELKIRDIRSSSAKFYREGSEIFDSRTNICLGKIKKIIVNDFYDYVTDINGEIKKSKKPGRIEVVLEIESKGTETDKAYFINGTYELKTNTEIFINTKYTDMIAFVEKINK
jgi:hypothetical protein